MTRHISRLVQAAFCIALLVAATTASAQVQAGVVGNGIHMQYGPQDANGDYLGIASESYDFYSDAIYGTGWGDNFPTWSGDQRPPDGAGYGYVLLAFNPYTGEVWTDIPVEHQALNPAGSYTGHAPSVSLSGVDGEGNPITSDWVSNVQMSGFTEDCVYITGEFIPRPNDGVTVEPFGSFVNTSADGGLLSVDPWTAYNTAWGAILPEGADVKVYGAADPDRPAGMYGDPGGDLDFEQTKIWGYTGFWDWGWGFYAGDEGGVANTLVGFEMDGIKGWMRLDFAAHRSGVRLTEYYFDLISLRGDFDNDGDIDADDIDILMANLGGDPGEFDLTNDGVVDQDDVDEWVFNIVPIGENIGTVYGDFNLDGEVNAGDLALLATNYGLAGTWGWATGDGNVDAGDLAMLATNYGTVVHTVPEPVTMSLLAIGGAALLRRRSR
jgi:hypothetical protein